jgi:hypothetical protein
MYLFFRAFVQPLNFVPEAIAVGDQDDNDL